MKKLFNDKIAELKSAWTGFWWIDLFSVALQIVIAYHEYYIVSFYTITVCYKQTKRKKITNFCNEKRKYEMQRTSIVHTITTQVDCLPLEHNDLK